MKNFNIQSFSISLKRRAIRPYVDDESNNNTHSTLHCESVGILYHRTWHVGICFLNKPSTKDTHTHVGVYVFLEYCIIIEEIALVGRWKRIRIEIPFILCNLSNNLLSNATTTCIRIRKEYFHNMNCILSLLLTFFEQNKLFWISSWSIRFYMWLLAL